MQARRRSKRWSDGDGDGCADIRRSSPPARQAERSNVTDFIVPSINARGGAHRGKASAYVTVGRNIGKLGQCYDARCITRGWQHL